jgi:epoxyqueuosine reductase
VILAMDAGRWAALAEGSPLARPGWESMARNAAVVLGNTGDRRHLPVLQAHRERSTGASAEAAGWAMGEISRRSAAE